MKYKNDILIFLGIWIFLYLVSVNNLIFPDFDWFNYRFYNCWAFLNDRMQTDFFASNFRTCFSPLIDLPEYFLLFKLNNYPYLFIFVTLLDNVALLFLVYKITTYIFKFEGLLKLFPLFYVAISPVLMLEMGFDQNDVKVAFLCLLSFYFLLKYLFNEYGKKRNTMIVVSGALIGLAMALKLTAIVYAIGFCIIIPMLYKRIDKPFKTLGIFILGLVPVFIVIDGLWMYKCYSIYHNPLFPYFNDIFKSEYADKIRLLDTDYSHLKPKSFYEFLFYPFLVSFNDKMFGTDKFAWDSRYAINFVCAVLTLLLFAFSKFKTIKEYILNTVNENYFIFSVLFSIIPFFVNISIFGTYRYTIPSSCIFGVVLFFIIILGCSKSEYKKIFIWILCLINLFYVYLSTNFGVLEYVLEYNKKYKTFPVDNIRYQKVFETDDLKLEDDAVVIMLNAGASAGAVTQNPKAKYIGFAYSKDITNKYSTEFLRKIDYFYDAKTLRSEYLEKELSRIFASDKKVYFMYSPTALLNFLKEGLEELTTERKITNCKYINMKVYQSFFWGVNIIMCEFNK